MTSTKARRRFIAAISRNKKLIMCDRCVRLRRTFFLVTRELWRCGNAIFRRQFKTARKAHTLTVNYTVKYITKSSYGHTMLYTKAKSPSGEKAV